MKTVLSVVLLGIALGVSAYVYSEKSQKPSENVEAVATEKGSVTKSIANAFDSNAAKARCFEVSKAEILKALRAPHTARFADNLSDVKFQQGEADSHSMASYVDAQDAFGAPIRMKWETLFDKDEKLVWMKIDDDEVEPLEDVLRRLKGLPSLEDDRAFAAEEAERVKQAAEARISELQNPKNREPLHAYAQKFLTAEMELQNHRNIKYSRLPKKDGKYTACYWLGNDVWEAMGVVESTPPNARRQLRQTWKVSMAVSTPKKPEVLAYRLGKKEMGDPDIARSRANVTPMTSK